MIIGIDGSRAFVTHKTGVENYSWHLIHEFSQMSSNSKLIFRLYLRPCQTVDFSLPPNWEAKILPWPRFFTQIGLAFETIIHPPDVLFIPAHTLPLLTKLFRPQVKIVVTLHGWEAGYLPKAYALRSRFWLLESTRWAVSLADHLIAVSQHTKKDIIKFLGCPSQKISVVYEGVDADRFSLPATPDQRLKIRNKYGLKGDYLLFVGTLQPRKNANRLIKAFARLAHHHKNLQLLIAGKFGWNYQNTLKLPQKLGIKSKVIFANHVPEQDLPTLYQAASAFCLPSLAEGFGLPLLEAMAAGVPVVAADTTALPEVVGNAGILVNPRSVSSISSGLEIALGYPSRLSRGVKLPTTKNYQTGKKFVKILIDRGQKRARQFTWKMTADNTLRILIKFNHISPSLSP